MASVTIKFRAKRVECVDGEVGYKVPALKSHHVAFSGVSSTREKLMLQSIDGGMARARAVFRCRVGWSPPEYVWEKTSGIDAETARIGNDEDSAWSIRQLGNGFMAELTRVVEF